MKVVLGSILESKNSEGVYFEIVWVGQTMARIRNILWNSFFSATINDLDKNYRMVQMSPVAKLLVGMKVANLNVFSNEEMEISDVTDTDIWVRTKIGKTQFKVPRDRFLQQFTVLNESLPAEPIKEASKIVKGTLLRNKNMPEYIYTVVSADDDGVRVKRQDIDRFFEINKDSLEVTYEVVTTTTPIALPPPPPPNACMLPESSRDINLEEKPKEETLSDREKKAGYLNWDKTHNDREELLEFYVTMIYEKSDGSSKPIMLKMSEDSLKKCIGRYVIEYDDVQIEKVEGTTYVQYVRQDSGGKLSCLFVDFIRMFPSSKKKEEPTSNNVVELKPESPIINSLLDSKLIRRR